MIEILMAVAGGLGALARFELASRIAARIGGRFPIGTMAVNISGAFLTGLGAGSSLSPDVRRVLVTGFLGGFTTFSTWMVETARLAEDAPSLRPAALNLIGMSIAGLLGAVLGATAA